LLHLHFKFFQAHGYSLYLPQPVCQ
jgi:hypothetical protein